jgi:hypothetical protein
MKKPGALIVLIPLVALALAGCSGGGEEAEREGADAPANDAAQAAEEVVVGGFTVEGPNGQEIAVPETTVDQAAAEDYAESLRPIVEETAGGLSQAINPSAELENQTLSLSIEVEAAEQARAAAQEGLEDLRQIQPPEELEPIHERLVNAYEQALPTYENIIWAFGSEDADTLTAAAREGLPEIERLIVEARTILRDLERAASQDARGESSQ